jgi:PAS domain-containing protein
MQLVSSPHRHHLEEAQRIAHVGSWEREIATGALLVVGQLDRAASSGSGGTFAGTLDAFLGFVPPGRPALATPSEADLATGTSLQSEYRIVRPDGTIRVIHEAAEVIRDADGTPMRLMGTTLDITERVEAEQDRARLASAVEQTADSIWMQDLDNTVIYVNRAFTRVYGYRPDEIVGKPAGLVDSGQHSPEFFCRHLGDRGARSDVDGSDR